MPFISSECWLWGFKLCMPKINTILTFIYITRANFYDNLLIAMLFNLDQPFEVQSKSFLLLPVKFCGYLLLILHLLQAINYSRTCSRRNTSSSNRVYRFVAFTLHYCFSKYNCFHVIHSSVSCCSWLGVKLLLKMGWRRGRSIKDSHANSLYGMFSQYYFKMRNFFSHVSVFVYCFGYRYLRSPF